MWVYIEDKDNEVGQTLWFVGFFDPLNRFHIDSEHTIQEMAARRCAWLNGSSRYDCTDKQK